MSKKQLDLFGKIVSPGKLKQVEKINPYIKDKKCKCQICHNRISSEWLYCPYCKCMNNSHVYYETNHNLKRNLKFIQADYKHFKKNPKNFQYEKSIEFPGLYPGEIDYIDKDKYGIEELFKKETSSIKESIRPRPTSLFFCVNCLDEFDNNSLENHHSSDNIGKYFVCDNCEYKIYENIELTEKLYNNMSKYLGISRGLTFSLEERFLYSKLFHLAPNRIRQKNRISYKTVSFSPFEIWFLNNRVFDECFREDIKDDYLMWLRLKSYRFRQTNNIPPEEHIPRKGGLKLIEKQYSKEDIYMLNTKLLDFILDIFYSYYNDIIDAHLTSEIVEICNSIRVKSGGGRYDFLFLMKEYIKKFPNE